MTLADRELSPMSAQTDLFEAFPVLRAAYMSLAHAIPPDLATAGEMLSLANQGYRPAQDAIQVFLAGGNHPSAGAQGSGGVADLMRPEVYDLFVGSYAGPLTRDAAAAVANRRAYLAWVERITGWVDSGAPIDQARTRRRCPAPSPPPRRRCRQRLRCKVSRRRPAELHHSPQPRHKKEPAPLGAGSSLCDRLIS